jgi:hypothetical protein
MSSSLAKSSTDLANAAAYVDSLIERLVILRAKSVIDGGGSTSSGKDLRAFEALVTAGQLVRALAGWAIDHTIGLALKDLSFVPLQPSGTKTHPQYKTLRTRVDDHRHEQIGKQADDQLSDPSTARAALINLINANAGAWPHELRQLTLQALEEISHGRKSALFKAPRKNRKVDLSVLRSQLRAVCCVEYLRARGMKKYAAQDKVADAYRVGLHTVSQWEFKLRKDLGALEVSRQISFAKNHAANANEAEREGISGALAGESIYGASALQAYGKRYQTLRRG